MSRILGVILLVTAILLQIAIWPDVTYAIQPAFVLVVAAAWGFATSMQRGFVLGVGGGALLDLYAGRNFGQYTLAILLAMGVLLAYSATRPGETGAAFRLSLFVAAAVVYELTVLGWQSVAASQIPFFAALSRTSTLNVLGSTLCFGLAMPLLGSLRNLLAPYAARPIQY